MPDLVYAQVSPRSLGKKSPFELATAEFDHLPAKEFVSDYQDLQETAGDLERMGFEVLKVTDSLINIAAPPGLYERVFGRRLVIEKRQVQDGAPSIHVEPADGPPVLRPVADTLRLVEGVAIETPRMLFAHPFPPPQGSWHLSLPSAVADACQAGEVHLQGITGIGVHVAMVDTGYVRHPYFMRRPYRPVTVVLAPGAEDPAKDEDGHGTAMAAVLLAVAPNARVTMVKANMANTTAAFQTAMDLQPDIICCGWGGNAEGPALSPADQSIALAVKSAVAQGITVVAAAGNGQFGYPGQHPDVIAAGGAFMHQDGHLEASSHSSGFTSRIHAGREVPDLAGLVGMGTAATYIMMPVPPGSVRDREYASSDGTPPDDGWAVFSGTSAAAAQIAGACALVKQVFPRATPADVKRILKGNARDITRGHTATGSGGSAARTGPDTATGSGLLNASGAALQAKYEAQSIR